jgi:predicted GH43/DUF377 family glycosyl hydrolase
MIFLLAAALSVATASYDAGLISFGATPVLSFLDGSSAYQQTFNPSWIVASPGTSGKAGLLIRSSNCSSVPGKCTLCNFGRTAAGSGCPPGEQACQDVITFSELLSDDNNTAAVPRFKKPTAADVVMAPRLTPGSMDDRGVQDPRVAFDPKTGLYYMFHTCFNTGNASNTKSRFFLCMAVSSDPTSPDKWSVRKAVFPQLQGSKSAAVLIRETGPHYMYWGAGVIHITSTNNLTDWAPATCCTPFISNTSWGNPHVESGPPPMRLSNGNYVFFHNSWGGKDATGAAVGYQPAWVIIDGEDPTKIVARAQRPLWSPSKEPWMEGEPPALCNVAKVAFLEAAHPTNTPDEFRVYFGGADTVIGTAVVKIDVAAESSGPG